MRVKRKAPVAAGGQKMSQNFLKFIIHTSGALDILKLVLNPLASGGFYHAPWKSLVKYRLLSGRKKA
jgi:hypothetical protein